MIGIDRLVLDVPGMTAARAGRLARAIGTLVAERGASGSNIALTLPPGAPSDDDILRALVAALDGRIA